jgi:lipoate-protein ligase A
MAVDDALLTCAQHPDYVPTLRLYSWQPACLSLGHAQPIAEIDPRRLAALGWDIVRRPTGGRAILHTDELTYSITANADHPLLQGGILISYQRISLALMDFINNFSLIPTSREEKDLSNKHTEPVCFEIPSNYEITVSGKKIIGSAQARRKSAVLQHGAIPLYGDITRITQALSYPDEGIRQKAAARVLLRATTLESETGKRISIDQAGKDLVNSFVDTHHFRFNMCSLSEKESSMAKDLEKEKYGNTTWTARL